MFKPRPEQIATWVEKHFECRERKGGQELLICSPFDGDTGYNFNINPEKAICHDWRGDEWARGKSRTFLRFVQVYKNCSYMEAVRDVCGQQVDLKSLYAKIAQSNKTQQMEQDDQEKRQYDIALPAGSVLLADSLDTLNGRIIFSWLKSRGISEDAVRLHKIHYHAMSVVWPYYEYDSLVYWQERDRMNRRFRFPSEEIGVTKGMFLYGFDMIEPCQYVIVNEAIIDSMTLGTQAVASGGAILTGTQARKLGVLSPTEGVILAPDNDKAGIESIVANYKLLSPYYKLFYAIPPKIEHRSGEFTKDWNDLGKVMLWSNIREEFENCIKPLGKRDAVRLMISGVPRS